MAPVKEAEAHPEPATPVSIVEETPPESTEKVVIVEDLKILQTDKEAKTHPEPATTVNIVEETRPESTE